MTVRRPLPRLAVLVVLLGLLSACSSAVERVTERAIEAAAGGNAEVNIDRGGEGTVEIRTDEGTVTMGSDRVPDEWPDDIPLPPGFRLTTSSAMASGDGQYAALIGNADLTPDEVDQFFSAALTGWTEASRMTFASGDGDLLSVTYEQTGRVLVLGLNSASGAELITLTYQAEASAP